MRTGRNGIVRVAVLGLVATLAVGMGTSTAVAKPPKPARIVVSADFVQINACFGAVTSGHIEVSAWDDDQTPVVTSSDRQADRVSIAVTRSDGTSWELDPIGVEVAPDGSSVFIATTSWMTGWTLRDGGAHGSAETGELDNGVAVTRDSMRYQGVTGCSSARFYLTRGNIKITPS